MKSKQEILEENTMAIVVMNPSKAKDPNLTIELFTIPIYQQILQGIKEVIDKKKNATDADLSAKMIEKGTMNTYLALMETFYSVSNYETYIEELTEQKAIREARNLLDQVEAEKLTLEEYQAKISNLSKTTFNDSGSEVTFKKIIDAVSTKDEILKFHKDKFFNRIVRPKKKSVNVIGAKTGVGKSAYAFHLINDLLGDYTLLYFNLELTETEVLKRLIAQRSGISIYDFEHLNDTQKQKIADKAWNFDSNDKKLYIYNGSKTVDSIRQIIAKHAKNGHVVAFVDHVGLVANRNYSRANERVQNTMIELNNTSKDFDCTIFALSQVNREAYKKDNGGLQTSNLSDSSEVEKTASSIVFVEDVTNDKQDSCPKYLLSVSKNRGKTGAMEIWYNRNTQQFLFSNPFAKR